MSDLTDKDRGHGFYDGEGRCWMVEERKGKLVWVRDKEGDSDARKHHPESYGKKDEDDE